MKPFFALCIFFSIYSQHAPNDFTKILPNELLIIILAHVPSHSLNEFAQFFTLQYVNKDIYPLVHITSSKHWRRCIKYLFSNDHISSLRKIKQVSLPSTYESSFISSFLLHSEQYNSDICSFMKTDTSNHLQEQELCDKCIFFLYPPEALAKVLNPFENSNESLFKELCNKKYMHEILFMNNSVSSLIKYNGLMICIEKSHNDLFVQAYEYAMKNILSSSVKYLEHDKIAFSKKLMLLSAQEANSTITHYLYEYLKNYLLNNYSSVQKIEFLHSLSREIFIIKCKFPHKNNDSIISSILQDLKESFK